MAASFKNFWKSEPGRATLVLLLLLHICFFPCIWGKKTLLESAREAPSLLWQGAWKGDLTPESHFNKVADPGAPAWQNEPWFALIRQQYFKEGVLPLWNPYQAYGVPLAANMQSQPFYPLTLAFILHLWPKTYNLYILSRLFIAGFFAYLYLRLFLSFYPALAGGVTSLLAGYYILFLTIPELSLAVLLPAGLFAGEWLLRAPRWRHLLGLAAVILLVFLGGGPETALLLFSLLYLYLAFRIVSDPELRPGWRGHAKWLALSTAAGLGLALFFLLPFVEYLPLSYNNHDPRNIGGAFRGMQHDARNVSFFTYLLPLLFGPVNNPVLPNTLSALRNYFGLISLFLILLAVSIASCARRKGGGRQLSSLTLFYFAVFVFVLLKRYGLLVNFVGSLPFYRLLDFPKYEELLLSMSVSVLAAIGVEHLITRRASMTRQCWILAVTFLFVPFAVLRSGRVLKKELLTGHANPSMLLLAVGVPVCLLLALAISLIWFNSSQARFAARRMGVVCLILLAGELSFNYIIPVYYGFNKLPGTSSDPYAGAPFVDFLSARRPNYERIIGQDGVLTPNWAAAFQLFDVRSLDALYVHDYFPWLQNFFPNWPSYAPELAQCFKGFGNFDFTHPLTRRLLQLSSVRYVVANRFFVPPDKTVEEILRQNQGRLAPGHEGQISAQSFHLSGMVRATLGEHPPYDRLAYKLTVPKDNSDFHFSYGIDAAAFHQPGDGVEFSIELRTNVDPPKRVFSSYVDPKHNLAERRWMDGEIDLRPYRNQSVELLLSTGAGPKDDSGADWAGWSNFHFGNQPMPEKSPFRPVYDHEVKISEYDDILPRAAVYYHADLEGNKTEVLRRLREPSFDVFQSVVLSQAALTPDERRAVDEINRAPAKRIGTATILSYRSQEVTIEANAEQAGILLLNDTGYPGWTAEVDREPARWFQANYFFRGVLLKPGKHEVHFRYRPRSFYAGGAASILTLIVLLAESIRRWRRRALSLV